MNIPAEAEGAKGVDIETRVLRQAIPGEVRPNTKYLEKSDPILNRRKVLLVSKPGVPETISRVQK